MTDLSGPPPSMTPKQTPQPGPPTQSGGGFDFNYPTIVALLYLGSFVFGITAIVGVVLAYVWKGESREAWEASHYQYLITTFWIGFIGMLVGAILSVVVIGIFIILGALVLVIIRSVLSLVNAQKREPMPKPDTWLA